MASKKLAPADYVIRAGFWTQLVLLFLIDWGSLWAFSTQEVHWIHYIGFTVVNVVLLSVTWVVWRWLREQRSTPTKL